MKRILSLLVLVLAVSCRQDYPYLRTPEAVATMDRVCGVYQLVSLDWDGGPVDLNGDGIAGESLLEEALSGPFLGLTSCYDEQTGRLTGRVEAAPYNPALVTGDGKGLYTGTPMFFPLFMGDGPVQDGVRVSLHAVYAYYQVDPDGNLVLEYARTDDRSYCDPRGAYAGMEGIALNWLENGDFRASAVVRFYDALQEKLVSGRETALYRCVSTKVRKER